MRGLRLLAIAGLAIVARAEAATLATFQDGGVAPTTVAQQRVRVELGGRPEAPSWFALTAPDRLVVDIGGARAEAGTTTGKGVVRRVRLAQFRPETVRVVIELAAPARVLRAEATPGGRGFDIVVGGTSAADFASLPALGRFAAVTAAPPPRRLAAFLTAPTAPTAPPDRDMRPLIVLDPGHGGHDVGAIGVEGRYEKDAALAVARAAADALMRNGRFRVRLTRTDDRFIPLPDRLALARGAGAALFVSVHCDSAPNPLARGATVYTLSDVASDKMAERAAARENRSGLLARVDLAAEEPEVADVLFDLSRRGTMNASARFAGALRAAMPPEVAFKGDAHRFAGFQVLKTADMPAVLFETGYVTNVEDAAFLFSEEGQRALGRGLAAAAGAFFAPRARVAVAAGLEAGAAGR